MASKPYNLNKCINYKTNKHLQVNQVTMWYQSRFYVSSYVSQARFKKKTTTACYRNQYKSRTIVFFFNPTPEPVKGIQRTNTQYCPVCIDLPLK